VRGRVTATPKVIANQGSIVFAPTTRPLNVVIVVTKMIGNTTIHGMNALAQLAVSGRQLPNAPSPHPPPPLFGDIKTNIFI
jgi:hypothetical protein